MRYYDFRLSNGESWFLKTEQTLYEIKNLIKNTDWIKLNSCGSKRSGDWTEYIPKEADVQCCNIVSVVEDIDYQKRIDEWIQDKTERLEIISNNTESSIYRNGQAIFSSNIKCNIVRNF